MVSIVSVGQTLISTLVVETRKLKNAQNILIGSAQDSQLIHYDNPQCTKGSTIPELISTKRGVFAATAPCLG